MLVHAATTGQSIEASCADLERSADSNTLRDYLNQAFVVEGLAQLEDEVNAALVAKLPKKVGKYKRELAIDLHDQAFYGKDEGLLSYASRGQAKAGTRYFYRIASVYLILDGLRFTLGVVFVQAQMSLADCVTALLARVKAQRIRVRCLYLDRGFAALEVYDYLQEQHIPAVIACPIRGKQAGIKALCRGRKSYTTKHTFRSRTQGERIHYRLLRQVRVYTNSRNPALRFLFMALALILLTLWLCLRFHFCQLPRRDRQGRSLDEARFRLHCFAAFLRRAIERRYGVRQTIEAAVLPRGV